MGSYLEERINRATRLFTNICIDLLGPTMVKAMTDKQAHMKVWPIFFVCQATGALHTQLAHDYRSKAFSLQLNHYIALRDALYKVVSDRGS